MEKWQPAATGRRVDRRPPSRTEDDEARAHLQARLVLFSLILLGVFAALVLFVLSLYAVYPETRPAHALVVHGFAIGGLLLLAAIWGLLLRRRRLSIAVLRGIDSLCASGVGCAFALSAYFSTDQPSHAFIWHLFMVFGRAILIPSTGIRTALVTACSFIPLAVAAVALAIGSPERLAIPPPAFVLGGCLFAAVAIILAATGSRVIYGLRRQVSEARQLGQYTLGEKIGEGAMGAVYRARHAMLRRPTAIKLLPPDKIGAHSLERFEREVQHMSCLTHPNTVAIFDYGRSADGVFYYAMEFLDGINLEMLVRRHGPQPAPRVIHILRQVCGALDEAHGMGLIHRDIKPANIILCQRGRKPDVAKVVDFGLVREFAQDPDTTEARLVAGTPAYVAPEAVTDPGLVGPRSDLYSLGAVAYFLLTGERVFDGKTAIDTCVQHVSTAPTPPSLRTTNPIPAELEALIMACLAKAPADRPDSARSLRFSLAQLPEARGWDESAALAWWHSFNADLESAIKSTGPSVTTVTIDVQGRTASMHDAALPDNLAGPTAGHRIASQLR